MKIGCLSLFYAELQHAKLHMYTSFYVRAGCLSLTHSSIPVLFPALFVDLCMCCCRFLTDEGIEFLREYLNLPSEIVPATLKKSTRPLERGGP